MADERLADQRLARRAVTSQQIDQRDHHAGRAVAALHRAELNQSALQPHRQFVIEAFDRLDRTAGDRLDRIQAGHDRLAVHQHRTRPTLALSATVFRAAQEQTIAQ